MSDVKVFDWDDEIENDGSGDFIILEEGDYEFEVVKFERGNYTPSGTAKTPACPQAIMTLKIATPEGDCFVVDRFPMATTMEWKISAFHRAVGLKKHGEKVKMQWRQSVGLKGKAHIIKKEGDKKDGVFFNNVGKYIDPINEDGDDEWN